MIKLLSGNGRFYFITYNSSRKLKKGSENGSGDCALIIEFLPLISRLRTRTRRKKENTQRKRESGGGDWRRANARFRIYLQQCTQVEIYIGSIIGRNLRFLLLSLPSSLSLSLLVFFISKDGSFLRLIFQYKIKKGKEKRAARSHANISPIRDGEEREVENGT